VQSPDRLRQLLVLTVCDIRAVGPDTWTGWKASLLRELYWRADERLSGSGNVESLPRRALVAKERLAELLPDWSDEERQVHLGKMPDTYAVAWDDKTLAFHANLLRRTEADNPGLSIEFQDDDVGQATVVTVCTLDHAGLFARLAGALALAGANIVGARAFTLNNGYVIDVFWVQASEGGVYRDRNRLRERVRKVLTGDVALADALQQPPPWLSRTAIFKVEPRVIVDNEASRYFTVIEVNGRDRPGFLNKVAWTMTQLGLQIASSHIATYGERAVDVFYVKDVFGLKVSHAGKRAQIEKALTEAIRESNALVTSSIA
jgi:[protein-PII] uridylyltransferase